MQRNIEVEGKKSTATLKSKNWLAYWIWFGIGLFNWFWAHNHCHATAINENCEYLKA